MTKKMWGGRFGKQIHPLVEEFTKSIHYDYKLAEWDVNGSLLQVEILKEAGFLTDIEAKHLTDALGHILKDIQKGFFKFDQSAEDIHTQIQNMLEKKTGETALKLQTARSRNEQVVFATKLFCKATLSGLMVEVSELYSALISQALHNKEIIIPGFTHMQHAQPIYLKDYLWAYANMFMRDNQRLEATIKNIHATVGAGSIAGTPIDEKIYDHSIKKIFDKEIQAVFKIQTTTNAVDVVSDRDFVVEILGSLSIVSMHLSRLAEDFIIWSTEEFDFIEIDESFCTGSSLMPQKKNPDVLELIRGYSGRLYGNWISVMTMMKGLPLAYNRDMQLDKEPLFNSFEIISMEIKVLTELIKTLKFNKQKISEHLKNESLYATDLVYYLVHKNVPFKDAHSIIGKLVKFSVDNGIKIKDMQENKLKGFSNKFVKKEIVKLFDPKVSVESKKSIKRTS